MPFRRYKRKTKRPYRKKRFYRKRKSPFVKTGSRLGGVVKQPYFRYTRCNDDPVISLSSSSAIRAAAGFYVKPESIKFSDLAAHTTLGAMYRFFRIKKVIIEYTPTVDSTEYVKNFAWPSGSSSQLWYDSTAGQLEIKHITSAGYLTPPTTWNQALNRSGKLRKCGHTRSFRRTVYPRVHQIIEDFAGADPMKLTKAPWLSTSNPSNIDLVHYLGIDCFHSMNNIDYDSSKPLIINKRLAVTIEFKGIKI